MEIAERRETARQRRAREAREARDRQRQQRAYDKEQIRIYKATRKEDIKRAITEFNRIKGVNCRFLSRVKTYYERHGQILTSEEVEEKLINEYSPIPQTEDRGEVEGFRVKDESGIFHRLKLQVFRVYKDVLFIEDNIPLMTRIFYKLFENVPNGFYFGCSITATNAKPTEDKNDNIIWIKRQNEPAKCIIKSTFINDINEFIRIFSSSEKLGIHSEQAYITDYFELFYFNEQGGGINNKVKINLDDLKGKYDIYNPTTSKNCGQMVLKQFNIESRGGYMTIADLKSYNPPLQVYSDINEVENLTKSNLSPDNHFILLRDNHFIICKTKTTKEEKLKNKIEYLKSDKGKKEQAEKIQTKINKPLQVRKERSGVKGVRPLLTDEQKKEAIKNKILYMKSEQYKLKKELNTIKKINNYNVLIFDLESYNETRDEKVFQIPNMCGTCEKKEGEYIFNYYEGEKCIKDFITDIKNSSYTHLIGYNSGKYDYLLIKNEIILQGGNLEEYTKGANGIMRVKIEFDNGKKIDIVDLLNFTSGKLSDNLENYGCETAKGEINYSKLKKWDEMGSYFKSLLINYLKSDVVGTYQLYEKLEEPYISRGLVFLDLFTSSQGAKKIVNYFWKIGEFEIQKTTSRKIDDFYRQAIYGGRCEVYKREFKSKQYEAIILGNINYDEIDDYIRALDKNSQYPEAMAFNLYPTGDETYTRSYKPDKLGIYKCEIIKPKNIVYPVCPDRANKYNMTNYNLFDCEGNYTNIDIEQMRKYGYKVKILYGYYWTSSDYIFKDYINEFYEIKKNTPKGTPLYNLSKLMMNAIYGKMIQRDKNEKNFIFTTYEQYEEARKKYNDELGEWSGYCNTEDATFRACFTFKEYEKKFTTKKSYIGAFILSYSKLEMYDMMTISDPYYTDTDSLYVENKYSSKFRMGEELGEFSDDHEGKIIKAIFSAKKLKYLEVLKPNYIYKLDDKGEPLLDKKGKKIIDKDEHGNKKYNNDNKYTIKRDYTAKGCDTTKLTTKDFEDMAEGLEVNNIRDFRMIRDLKNGEIEYKINDSKSIKMNDSNRFFKGNNSLPLGHEEIPI